MRRISAMFSSRIRRASRRRAAAPRPAAARRFASSGRKGDGRWLMLPRFCRSVTLSRRISSSRSFRSSRVLPRRRLTFGAVVSGRRVVRRVSIVGFIALRRSTWRWRVRPRSARLMRDTRVSSYSGTYNALFVTWTALGMVWMGVLSINAAALCGCCSCGGAEMGLCFGALRDATRPVGPAARARSFLVGGFVDGRCVENPVLRRARPARNNVAMADEGLRVFLVFSPRTQRRRPARAS